MGDENKRRAAPVMQIEHQLDDLIAGCPIKVTGRLIRHQDLRVTSNRARKRHPLLLTPRQLTRVMGQTMGQSHLRQFLFGPRKRICAPGQLQGHRHIFERRHGWDQVKRLENNPHMVPPEERQRIFIHGRHILTHHLHRATGWFFQSGQHHEKRTFPRS